MKTSRLLLAFLAVALPALAAADTLPTVPQQNETDRILCESLAEKASRQAGEAQPGPVFQREFANCVVQLHRNDDRRSGIRSRIPGIRDIVPIR